jgi:peroxin-19
MSSDASKAPKQTPDAQPEEAPDPDEDELSDLDDVLDEFATTRLDSKPVPASSGPGRPSNTAVPSSTSGTTTAGILPDDDEFARQLQAGMADLLGELESSPDMQRQFEQLVKELGEAAEAAAPPSQTTSQQKQPTAAKDKETGKDANATATAAVPGVGMPDKPEDSFQDTIRKTMERMQASGESASAAAASQSATEEDFLAAMLKEMEKGGMGGGFGSDEDFSKMLMGMMEQLTNKEILYEPMKELDQKFPGWLEENGEKVGKEDLQRYRTQAQLVKEIVGKFEETGFSDEKVECREYIVERMQKVLLSRANFLMKHSMLTLVQMQAAGSPPSDLVGDMNSAQEALGELDAGCPTQ